MSELQISLLAIGLVVVVGVFLYGQWQQWRYRRDRVGREAISPVEIPSSPVPIQAAQTPDPLMGTVAADAGPCSLLAETTDYVATFTFPSPLMSGVLEALWQRRFDFGKTVTVCGLNHTTDLWERVVPESTHAYRAFRIGLQLVDRSGPVSEARLGNFHGLLQTVAAGLQAEVRLPSVPEALQRAQELDRFCASVDQLIGINLLASGEHKLFGTEVANAAERIGMRLEADGSFHLPDEDGATWLTLGASDGSLFQPLMLNQTRVSSLTLLLDIPRVSSPVRRFDRMITLAQELAGMLRLTMVDDRQVVLGEGAIAQIRAGVAATESRMLAGHITPGSPQALRLFS